MREVVYHLRPVSAPGRWRRLAPFGAVLGLGLVVSPLPPVVDPAALAVAVALLAGIVAGIAWLPWQRWPWWAEGGPAIAFCAVIAALRIGAGGVSGYAPLVLLPIFWLALYHGPKLLLSGLITAAFVVLWPTWSIYDRHGARIALGELRLALLFLAAVAVVAWTTNRLVRHTGRTATRLTHTAAELSAESTAFRRERDFTNAVLDTAGILIVVLDAAGRITVFNSECETVTGLPAADVLGRPFFDVVHAPADVPEVRTAFERLTAGDFPTAYINDWVGADGGRRTIAWRSTALTEADGSVSHVISTGMDITEQRRTERMFARVLAAATEQAIVATDRDGLVTVFNAGAERLLGYRSTEVVGLLSPLRWHLPEELEERALELGLSAELVALRPGPASGPRAWTFVRVDGTEVPVEVSVSEIRDERGEVSGYLSVARDISQERRRLEALRVALARETAAADRLRELDRFRNDLVATVSHELRTPLTSILGNVEVLADGDAGPLTGPQAKLLGAIERNSRRLLTLIEDLLILSRIEAGAVKINARPVPLRAIVGGALEALQSVRAGRGVELEVELPGDTTTHVLGDQAQLERVLINLVDNGLKFTPTGGRVRVSVDPGQGDRFARVTVADTGIGIPPDEVDQIFDRFFRSTRSQEQAMQGTGLGLAITKSIVERHGGRIWARSGGERTGTEITCLLPKADPD